MPIRADQYSVETENKLIEPFVLVLEKVWFGLVSTLGKIPESVKNRFAT